MEEIYGAGEIRVNSSHHQAVRQVAQGLRVGAMAPDGVIEAIEATDAQLVLPRCAVASGIGDIVRAWTCSCSSASCRRVVRQAQSLQLAA